MALTCAVPFMAIGLREQVTPADEAVRTGLVLRERGIGILQVWVDLVMEV